ncbi:hypothetical protein PF008_g17717 [Phytophthora fragariae]|uniref:SUEL-type lectin domain-containing protein n=2 Tax=Phytophthora fragariae TaxID=53985 RepID=A0A6G0R7U9_9STRA|nr:hypothetical protein PF008_g17717 [Phytophthora fragariae]
MKSFRLRVLRVVWLLLSLVCTVQADTLIAKVLYDVKASCNGKVTPAVKATAVPTTATCYKNVACDVVDKMYSATYCPTTDATGVYLADKKCHKTGKSASFRATRSIDGAVTIKTYATADCSGNEATNVDWDVAKATGNTCVDGADGVADTLVGGWSATPLYLELAATFSKNTDECTSPGIPILLESTTVEVDACKVSGSCTAAGSLFTRTLCSSSVNIQNDAAAIFGRMPFVIVEAFHPGKSCAPAELDNITIYLADGRCHKTGDSTSYVATRTKGLLLPGSDDTITTYTDAVCTPDKEELELPITARQEGENSCGEYSWTGILDKLIYGGGYTPLYLQSTATFESGDNHCVSPIYLDTTVVGTNACTASEDCTAAGDLFTGTLCSSTATFKDDAVAAFHSTPFVVVETFTAGADCATTSLTSIKTYTADLKCHATGAGASFLATRSESGDMTVVDFSDAACQHAIGDPLTVGADGAGRCSNDQIVYGVGESPTVLSTVLSFDNAGCTKPVQLIATNEFSCTASTVCTATSGHYLQHSCSADHFHTAATMFGVAPYVVVELYKEDDCTTLDGVQVYSSDKNCHVDIDGTSFTSTLAETGDGDLVHYSDDKCEATGDDKTTTALSVKMLGAKPPCTNSEQVKYYAFNGPANPSKTPSTPTTTTATPTSTTEAPTTTSTGSGTSDASSRFVVSSTLTVSLMLLATALGLVI